jgi:hypothetical protein
VTEPATTRRSAYSADLRTAVVFSGVGADGAYHAGVLRALQEAGLRIDLLAGHGVGAIGAIFGCIDGGTRLWNAGGLWRASRVKALYPWRITIRALGWTLLAAAAVVAVPLALLAVGLIVFELSALLDIAGPGTAARVSSAYSAWLAALFAPGALPTWLPRAALVIITSALALVLFSATRFVRGLPARRRQRDGFWWAVLGAPLSAADAAAWARAGLWDLLRGGAAVRQPETDDLGRRYSELLADNLGQPGFRELLLVVHDLDARRDLVFALLRPDERRRFFLRRAVHTSDRRSTEAFDLAGVARDHTMRVVAGALALPVVCEPEMVVFPPESPWRGEAHRLTDRPGVLTRLLEELVAANVRQVLLVTASPELAGPHGLSARRVSPRSRLSDFLAASQTAGVRDALAAADSWFDRVFVIRPAHNPVGPLDLTGAFDERSDRHYAFDELIERGYEDAYRQFIEPVVGASGEALETDRGAKLETRN